LSRSVFFAGGGSGGHIYPYLAVAEQLREISDADLHCFCSERQIDSQILSSQHIDFSALPAQPLRARPAFVIGFIKSFMAVRRAIKRYDKCVVVGCGGYVSGPAILAARFSGAKSAFINVDIVPGKANRRTAGMCDKIFLQFEKTKQHFAGAKAELITTGCPLRGQFSEQNTAPDFLDETKKLLFVTGASNGAENINKALCLLAGELEQFGADWEIVVVSGKGNAEALAETFKGRRIKAHILEYTDQMAALLKRASLVIGRSGAGSVAEYEACATPAVCVPYPYHKDMHQRLHAMELCETGRALIAEDCREALDKTAENLRNSAIALMKDERALAEMKENCLRLHPKRCAAETIARIIAEMLG
jgi:UDP-N-acetylglucosamine--N-acetylmuramyl-(pentapeptide) pyrophosphoryl-undecaprenol N-acetylglucosamine transferase